MHARKASDYELWVAKTKVLSSVSFPPTPSPESNWRKDQIDAACSIVSIFISEPFLKSANRQQVGEKFSI